MVSMKLSERLHQADHETLVRALCHAVALAAAQTDTGFPMDATARTILGIALDAGSYDWSPPFQIDGQSLTSHAGEALLRRVYTDLPPGPENQIQGT